VKLLFISGPWRKNNYSISKICLKFIDLFDPDMNKIIWIATNMSIDLQPDKNIDLKNIRHMDSHEIGNSCIKDSYYTILHQLKISKLIFELILFDKVDIIIFCFGSDLSILPMFLGRIFRKKVILRIEGPPSYVSKMYFGQKNILVKYPMVFMEKISYKIATVIGLEYKKMIELYDLKAYEYKSYVLPLYVPDHFFDSEFKRFQNRKYDIGYIGRFSKEKGCLNFVHSLPHIKNIDKKAVIMIGDGGLKYEIRSTLDKAEELNVELVDWVKYYEIPKYLNDIKILVIPSYYEGLPNILPEAMACGCIILATPVGGITEVVKDGVNGFIMKDNSSESIAKNINSIIMHENLREIGIKARADVERRFGYNNVKSQYKKLMDSL